MSKEVTLKEFCKRYELDPSKAESKKDYQKYCENLSVVNFAFAEEVTKEAIKGMK